MKTNAIHTLFLALFLLTVPLLASAEHEAGHVTETSGQTTEAPESAAAAYQFKNEGIFGCNQVAGANASAGTVAAIGGVYVPVNDAAVTLNTGILVYKECVLRPLQDRLRESAMSALLKKNVLSAETGREGNKQYVVNLPAEILAIKDKAAYTYLTGPALDNVRPEFREDMRRALAASYSVETRGTDKPACTYDPNAEFSLQNFQKLRSPSCNAYFDYLINKKPEMDTYIGEAVANQTTVWDWGRGFYAVTDNPDDPLAEQTFTPASVVQSSFQTVFDSPVRQLEQANDIGQMIGALFAGVTTQALTDRRGLSGLTQSVAGQPSYLEQVAKESSQGVIGAAVNAALTVLNTSRDIEGRYLTAMESIATTLTQSINQIRNTERQCWELIVPKAQQVASIGTCTITDPSTDPPTRTCTPYALDQNKIKTSTSTLAFSQQVIDSQITPLANAALTNIQNSRKALALIDQLIASVTNTASLNTQRIALQQLDSLVAQKALHTKFDAENAAKQRDDVAGAMTTLVQDTATAWGDSPTPTTGWCNINNSAIPQLWADRWKK